VEAHVVLFVLTGAFGTPISEEGEVVGGSVMVL